jgi:hypothetical protein
VKATTPSGIDFDVEDLTEDGQVYLSTFLNGRYHAVLLSDFRHCDDARARALQALAGWIDNFTLRRPVVGGRVRQSRHGEIATICSVNRVTNIVGVKYDDGEVYQLPWTDCEYV